MLRPLFSIAPMLKSLTATMLNTSRSYSRPKRSSSQRMARFERLHRPGAAILLAGLDIDGEVDLAARRRDEAVGHAGEIAADERKKIRRLGEGIVPDGEVALGAGDVAMRQRIAVGQKHGRRFAFGLDAHGVDGEHVGPVDEIGDAAETLRLALGAIGAARAVEAGKRRVRVRIACRHDVEREGLGRDGSDRERGLRDGVVLGRKTLAVQGEALEDKSLRR